MKIFRTGRFTMNGQQFKTTGMNLLRNEMGIVNLATREHFDMNYDELIRKVEPFNPGEIETVEIKTKKRY